MHVLQERVMVISFILAILPIVFLAAGLLVWKLPAYQAAAGSFLISAVLALLYWKMPVSAMALSALEGALMALWPIALVILAAVFAYRLTLRTGAMDRIRQMITAVSDDRRVLALLVAWCFGGFMEGMAGFGTAIAIPAGMLVTLGFEPMTACLLCLIANGTPTPFGSIGIPTITLANLVGLDAAKLAAVSTLQLGLFSMACPFLIVMAAGGGPKALKGMIPTAAVSGIAFVIPQYLVSRFAGPELAAVTGSLCSLGGTVLLARRIKDSGPYAMAGSGTSMPSVREALNACAPYLFVILFLLGTSRLVAPVNAALSGISSTITLQGSLTFSWINTPGIWIFLSSFIGGWIQGARWHDFRIVFLETFNQMKETILTIISVLACAKIMGYSGMIGDIASFAITASGALYPLLAPWIGALGTFVTGSGTNSGVLFGAVQKQAAETLQVDPYWMVGLNSLGVAAGKMLGPQSLAIALSAVNEKGRDAELMKRILPYTAAFLILMSLFAWIGTMLFG